jgi:repressor of nif and glnA expression
LLEIKERRITRFLNMIEYSGSTLDPLEVFMRADMTRVRDVILRGSGIICASFREIPSAARDQVGVVQRALKRKGMTGILAVGRPSQPLFGVAVSEGHCGMVVAGGLNPIASACEAGVRVTFQSLAGLVDMASFMTTREALRRFG